METAAVDIAAVLVVDDDPVARTLIGRLLHAQGYGVHVATDAYSAVAAAREHQPDAIVLDFRLPGGDVVLLDIQMPEMDGFETARALRENPSLDEVPFVAVTALAMAGDREMILEAGFAGYIVKPIDPARLLGEIAPFLPQAA